MQSKPIAWFLNNGYFAEAVVWRCSAEKVFLEIWQFTGKHQYQGKACNFFEKETWAQEFSCEFCEMSKNIFSYRTSLVAASDLGYKWVLFSCWLNFFGFNICKDIFHNIFQFKLFILLYGVMSFFVPKYFEKYKKYISEYIS